MLKKATIAALVAGLALAAMPAQAKPLKRKNITFTAEVPCTFVCPYWLQPNAAAPSAPAAPQPSTNFDPLTDDPVDFGLDSADYGLDYAFDAADAGLGTVLGSETNGCTDPGPEGAYDDIVVKAPRKAKALEFEAWPEVDWDIFICAKPKRGQTGSKYLTHGANTAGGDLSGGDDLCGQTAGTLGCYEKAQIKVRGGRSYVLRAYNWGDPSPLRARYTFWR